MSGRKVRTPLPFRGSTGWRPTRRVRGVQPRCRRGPRAQPCACCTVAARARRRAVVPVGTPRTAPDARPDVLPADTGFAKAVQPFVCGGTAAMFASACVRSSRTGAVRNRLAAAVPCCRVRASCPSPTTRACAAPTPRAGAGVAHGRDEDADAGHGAGHDGAEAVAGEGHEGHRRCGGREGTVRRVRARLQQTADEGAARARRAGVRAGVPPSPWCAPSPPTHRLSASLMRQAVYGTARLGLHREFSDRMKASQGGGALPAWKSVLSSMGSGAIASVIGTPFDVSLVRMQADSLKPVAGACAAAVPRTGRRRLLRRAPCARVRAVCAHTRLRRRAPLVQSAAATSTCSTRSRASAGRRAWPSCGGALSRR